MIFPRTPAFLPSLLRFQFPSQTNTAGQLRCEMPAKAPTGATLPTPQLRRSSRRRTPTQHLNSSTSSVLSGESSLSQASRDLSPAASFSSSSGSESEKCSDADFEPKLTPDTQTGRTSRSNSPKDGSFRPAKRVRPAPKVLCGTGARCFTPAETFDLRTRLLDWYVANHRDLPWRSAPRYRKNAPIVPLEKPDHPSARGAPYSVWVSEVMSQQTRIQVVVDYFQRWMKEFPTIKHLANADLDRVNELWAGLGYYRRARFLHEGAKEVMERYDGELPADVPSLLKIKGIGRYTAGAISSMAFGHAAPLVDGNVQRVLARLLPALSTPMSDGQQSSAVYWSVAGDLVRDIECAGDLNQALMEFGATHCKPRAVQCLACPLQNMCGAYQEATALGEEPPQYVTRYPIKDAKKATKVRDESVAVLVVRLDTKDGAKFLVLQRPPDGLLAGLWEAPNFVAKPGEDGLADAWEKLQALLEDAMESVGPLRGGSKTADLTIDVGTVTHIFSHIRQTLHVKVAVFRLSTLHVKLMDGSTSQKIPFRWLLQKELDSGAVSTQMRKVFAASKRKVPKATALRK